MSVSLTLRGGHEQSAIKVDRLNVPNADQFLPRTAQQHGLWWRSAQHCMHQGHKPCRPYSAPASDPKLVHHSRHFALGHLGDLARKKPPNNPDAPEPALPRPLVSERFCEMNSRLKPGWPRGLAKCPAVRRPQPANGRILLLLSGEYRMP